MWWARLALLFGANQLHMTSPAPHLSLSPCPTRLRIFACTRSHQAGLGYVAYLNRGAVGGKSLEKYLATADPALWAEKPGNPGING